MDIWNNHREAINTGKIACYNIMGLAIPYYMTPMSYTTHFTKNLQVVGNISFWDECHVSGDVENLDFMALYTRKGFFMGALVSDTQNNMANMISEGFRYGMVQKMEDFVEKRMSWEKMEKIFKSDEKYRCFNDEIFEVRFDPIPQQILWRERDRMGDTYYNRAEDGLNPNVSELDPSSDQIN